jgi:hypothetical protein
MLTMKEVDILCYCLLTNHVLKSRRGKKREIDTWPWTPAERLRRNYQTAEALEELQKAGQKHRGGNQR